MSESSSGAEPKHSLILRPSGILSAGKPLSGHELVIADGRNAALRPATGPENLPGRLLLPGFVNAHSHAFQRGLRGHVQWRSGDDDFWSWRERMYALATGLDPQGVEDVSALAFLEMAQAGFTTVGEFHYLHHSPDGRPYADPDELARRVIRAARRVGIRICLLRVAYGRAGFEQPANRRQRRFIDRDPDAALLAAKRLARIEDPKVSVGLAPHSVRACPRRWLQAFSSFEGPLHMHVSEQPGENRQCIDETQVSPTALIDECGLLSPRFHAVHMTWPTAGDADRLRRSGAGVVACPTTELDLGDGFLQQDQLEGVPLSIGTDSHARIDPFAEIRALELHARGLQGRRNVLSPPEQVDGLALRLLDIGARGGAAALGLEGGTGAVGEPADWIGVDLNDPVLACARMLPAVVMAGHVGMVTHSWVGGDPVLVDRRHPLQAEILEAATRALATVP